MNRPFVVASVVAMVMLESSSAAATSGSSRSWAANVTGNPLRLTLTLSASRTTVGSAVKAKGSATNLATRRFADVAATISVPFGIVVAGPVSHDLGSLGGGATTTMSWTLCASAAGNYLVMVNGTARDSDGRTWTASSGAVMLIVSAGSKRCRAFGL